MSINTANSTSKHTREVKQNSKSVHKAKLQIHMRKTSKSRVFLVAARTFSRLTVTVQLPRSIKLETQTQRELLVVRASSC